MMPEMNALSGFLVEDVIRMLAPSLVVDCPLQRCDSILFHAASLSWHYHSEMIFMPLIPQRRKRYPIAEMSPSPRIDNIRFEPIGRS